MDAHDPEEDFESIPWTSVLEHRDRPAWQPAVGGLLAGAVLVLVLLRLVPGGGAPEAAPQDPEPAAVSTTVLPPTSSSTEPPPALLLPEADLMAVDTPDLAAEAARMAEWFLTDFFTVDDQGRSGADRWISVPPGLSPVEETAPSSHVEEVEVLDTRRAAPDRVVVTAVVRRVLDSDPDVRDVLGLEVEVAFGDTGARIVDLPRPAAVGGEPIPEQVLAVAVAALAPLVDDGLLEHERTELGWRLVFAARDRFGMVWPVAVTVDAGEVPADP